MCVAGCGWELQNLKKNLVWYPLRLAWCFCSCLEATAAGGVSEGFWWAQWPHCGSHAQEMALVCVRPAPCQESPIRVSTAVQLPQGHRHRRRTLCSQVPTLLDRFFSLQVTSRGGSALGPGCLDSFSLPLSLRTCYMTNYSKRRISIWMLGIITYLYRILVL